MPAMQIAQLGLGKGVLGLCPLPGRGGQYVQDLAALADFAPQLVLSLVEIHEYQRHNAPTLPADLAALTIEHLHLPIRDFGTPKPGLWPAVGPRLHAALDQGGRVAIHCLAGCGRTGMIALRLMIEAGESPAAALLRLRAARPCAVETKAQQRWAEAP